MNSSDWGLVSRRCRRQEHTPCWDESLFHRAQNLNSEEWNLVCDEAWKAPFATSVFFLGVLTGSLASGPISDRFGRKIVFFGNLALQTISTLVQASSNSWEIYCIFNLLSGFGAIAKYNAAFVLGSELLCKSARVMFASLGVCMFYSVGYMILPLFAYFIRGWRMLLVALASVGFLYIPLWWFIPESPRWLMTQGRVAEAEAIIQAAARRNGVSAPEVIFRMEDSAFLNQTDSKKEHQQKYTLLDLFKTSNIRNITLIILTSWMVTLITYYGINLGTSNMGGNSYLNCFISGACEMASYITAFLVLRYCRRRFTLFALMLLSGSMLLIVQLLPQDMSALTLPMVMLGKTATTAGACFIYVYSIELFPTVVRTMGVGLVSTSGCISSITAPYIPYIVLSRVGAEDSPAVTEKLQHHHTGYEIFADFKAENMQHFWNKKVTDAISETFFLGWIDEHVLLIQGKEDHLEVLREGWMRRSLKPPRGFEIKCLERVVSTRAANQRDSTHQGWQASYGLGYEARRSVRQVN
ncbi:hypothetical protein AAFF_G00272920 [Aldrovandia affinis]|uniref:Major facilitator superfamily (MFS) profile domain-containing protein n=1 Tax=Aldrovandia affinis TaxID=143900 RepID=A0AAD7SRH1_9TELE|nr:hypothetical protein AAFF_G00272920 [Aldrovandia affinis]